MSVGYWCSTCFCIALRVGFCTGHFVMVPINFTYLHCLQHSFFEHLFNFYYECTLNNCYKCTRVFMLTHLSIGIFSVFLTFSFAHIYFLLFK